MHSLDRQITARAERRGDAVAIAHGDDRVSYHELESSANRIARALRRAGVQPGDRVCLVAPKSPRAIETIIGILKTGAMYVPLDPDSPAPRARSMVESCDTRWIVASHKAAGVVAGLFDAPGFSASHVVGWLDDASSGIDAGDSIPVVFRWNDVQRESTDVVSNDRAMDSPAYILFTSGSTGVPKGVVISHANVAAYLAWALPYFGFSHDDRISGHPPLHFDLSVFDIFGALTAGAQLHLVSPELNLQPARIVRLIADAELTQWFSVPAVMSLVAKFDLLAKASVPSLQRVLWCGEALPTSTLMYWMDRLPDVRYTNLYGPTETTIASSFYTVPRRPESNTDAIPIGTACDGEELIVLDEHRRDVPADTIGDLFIGGVGLSEGYWRDAEKTATAFIADPRPGRHGRIYRTGDLARTGSDGLVYFIGRADTQIKSRGYRIELGEIEAALAAEQDLKESAVVGVETGGFDGTAICCAFVPLAGNISPTDLRSRLSNRLPPYMLPSRWRQLDALPRNANGKVDRPTLQAAFRAGDA